MSEIETFYQEVASLPVDEHYQMKVPTTPTDLLALFKAFGAYVFHIYVAQIGPKIAFLCSYMQGYENI